MKKFKNDINIFIIIILLIFKYFMRSHVIPSLFIIIGGIVLISQYLIYFSGIYTDLNMKYKNICLYILVFSMLITCAINASTYVSDLVTINGFFMFIVTISKWLYLLSNLYFLNEAYTVKKYRILSVLFVIVAYLNIFESLINIESILEIIAIIVTYGLGKYGRIINLQKKHNK